MLAFEPATPFDDYFHTPNISASSRALSQIQSNFEHILTPGFHQHTQFDPSQRLDHGFDFVSSPLSSQASVFGSPHFQSEAGSFGGFGLPIARRHQRHHRDLSGDSSLASSASSLLFDNPQAIDPTALAPPLAPPPTAPVISPFINQTVEQGPDGTITGRYQRPLTSTGRPSHARKTPPGHVKRPRNAFILFRSHACAANLIPPTVEKDHRQISRIVSHMWRDLPAEERGRWEREAEQEKELHRRLHPDYRYKPVYRKDTPAKKKSPISRRKPAHRKTPVSETSPPSTTADEDERSPSEREQSRDEALRCEAVARVVMEVKLSGATLDEGQIEARVSEEIRNVRQQHQQKKPQGIIPTPLQTRRKSRANSAPPPPSPIRQMHAQQLIYNPKSRGSRGRQPTHLSPSVPSRQLMFSYTPLHSSSSSSSSPTLTSPELSPDFPKPRNSEEMMPYSSSWPIHFWNSTPPDQQQASSFDYTLLSNQSSAIASLVPSREFGASNGLRMFDEEPFHGFHHEEVHEDQIQQGFLSMGHDDDVPRRRPSVMVNGLGEFPVVPFDHSTAASPTWTLTQEDRPGTLFFFFLLLLFLLLFFLCGFIWGSFILSKHKK